MKTPNRAVDRYLSQAKTWQKELQKLRELFLASPLTEEFKWSKPCYTYQESNIAVICGLKEACAIGFLKGALLKDAKGALVKPGADSQSMRWMKFSQIKEITERKSMIRDYIQEAIEAEKAGRKIVFKENHTLVFPEEFQSRLDKTPALKKAFDALTPGRKRGYHLYFSGAKQSKTRESRIEKCLPQILKGKGFNER